MNFQPTPTGYEKTILSDLQGAWNNFRQSVVESIGFVNADKVLFYTDEAMSWEVIRDLKLMPPLILSIRNLCNQGKAPEDVLMFLNKINDTLAEILNIYSK